MRRESRDIGTGILFGLLEKIMMNEVARLGHTRIVLIEDDLESRESLRMLLEEEGAEVVAVADAEEGAETVIRELPDATAYVCWHFHGSCRITNLPASPAPQAQHSRKRR